MIVARNGQIGHVGEQVDDLNRSEYWPAPNFEIITSTLFIDAAISPKTGHDHDADPDAATKSGHKWA
jgi:hypothetical protein